MASTLPPRPDMDWLRKTAKSALSTLRQTDPNARLHQAQHALAKQYGFASWRQLKAHVDGLSVNGRLLAAAQEGDADTLAALLDDHPSKITITGGRWDRPLLHLAAEAGHEACVTCLLARGFPVDRRDRLDNATALHWAAEAGRIGIVKHLIDAGADVEGTGDAHHLGVLGWATCLKAIRRDVAQYLLAKGATPHIFVAIALEDTHLLRRLIAEDRQRLSARMSRFEALKTPLHFAVAKNAAGAVTILLEEGADPLASDAHGIPPMGEANADTDSAIIDALIKAGADPAARGRNRFQSAVPILNVANVPASIAYYQEALGFTLEWDWENPATFACVMRDDVRIFLCQDGQGAKGMWISIFVDDVDRLHQTYTASGALIRMVPTTFPWGVREMNVADPDGHIFRMGSEAPLEDEPAA
ncbi:MAG: ankyrin repeat domain-containing protein [Pseudomonadota bacterium]